MKQRCNKLIDYGDNPCSFDSSECAKTIGPLTQFDTNDLFADKLL